MYSRHRVAGYSIDHVIKFCFYGKFSDRRAAPGMFADRR